MPRGRAAAAIVRDQKVVKLKQSKLPLELSVLKLTQDELLGNDIDLSSLNMALKGSASIHLLESVTAVDVTRQIDGASSVQVDVIDQDRTVMNSGRLAQGNDIEIDGLWFRLAAVRKTGDTISLTFEDREVNVLREYRDVKKVAWDTITRQQFVERILKEPKEFKVRYVIETINTPGSKPTKTPQTKGTQPTPAKKQFDRAPGFPQGSTGVTVKGSAADSEQLHNISVVIDVGLKMGARRKVIVTAIMVGTHESSMKNLSFGPGTSKGVFQQKPEYGWPASGDVATDAAAYYKSAINIDTAQPTASYGSLCSQAQVVPPSEFASGFELYHAEADRTVSRYGVVGGDAQQKWDSSYDPAGAAASAANNQGLPDYTDAGGGASKYEFTQGTPTTINGVTKWIPEDAWTCLQRLASEINWRCFCVSGTVYFVSDTYLFQSKPILTLSEKSDGVDNIDFDYDVGKHNATATITCRTDRWAAPPGSTIEFEDMGPIDGKWLVNEIQRSIFDSAATISLTKPRPVLPEAMETTGATAQIDPTTNLPKGTGRQNIVDVARKALAVESTDHYHYSEARPIAGGLFTPQAHAAIDCSGFATLVYKAAGVPDPNGNNYNGSGNTGSLAAHGTRITLAQALPGDLLFFHDSWNYPHHVAIFVGNNQTIEIGSDAGIRQDVANRDGLLGAVQYPLA